MKQETTEETIKCASERLRWRLAEVKRLKRELEEMGCTVVMSSESVRRANDLSYAGRFTSVSWMDDLKPVITLRKEF